VFPELFGSILEDVLAQGIMCRDRIVLFSGGLGSFEVARRVLARIPKSRVRLWFFDTLIEDHDLYRFLTDAEILLGKAVERYTDGRNPWEVFRDKRFIGNTRVCPCNWVLKIQMLRRLLRQSYPSGDAVLCFGLGESEGRRITSVSVRWKAQGYDCEFPLVGEVYPPAPSVHTPKRPRLYELGFSHNNCGGACVKAGIRQWTQLLRVFPERYRWHEEQEEQTRLAIGKDIAILRDRTGGSTKPLTLRELRTRIEWSS